MTGNLLTSVDPSSRTITVEPISQQNDSEKLSKTIAYDILIIATGSAYSTGLKPRFDGKESKHEDRVAGFRRVHDEIKRNIAREILIVGGGAVGCEMAGQIVDMARSNGVHSPHITLVHSGERLLQAIHPDGSEYAKQSLERRGVRVMLQQRINDLDSQINANDPVHVLPDEAKDPYRFHTSTGTEITAHMVIDCRGPRFNGSSLQNSALKGAINERGQIRVTESLQVVGYNDIFALGDVNDVPCMKYARCAILQAKTMGKNLRLLLPLVLEFKKLKKDKSHDLNDHWDNFNIPKLNIFQAPTLRQGIQLGSADMVVSTETRVLTRGAFPAKTRQLFLSVGASLKSKFDSLGVSNIKRLR